MKVALHITSLNFGGAERATVVLANCLAAAGLDIDLLVCDATGACRDLIEANVKLVDFGGIGTVASVPKLCNYLRAAKPDILVTALHQPGSAGLLAKRITRSPTKVVVQIHSTISAEATRKGGLKQRLMPFFAKRLFPSSDGLAPVSHAVAKDLIEYLRVPPALVRTIHCVVVTDQFRRIEREPPGHPWLSDSGPPVVLSVGRLAAPKDNATLIKAVNEVRKSQPVRLLILGDGEQRQALEALVESLEMNDVVAMPGFSKNPISAMAAAHVTVLSSKWEGMPTVLIESLAVGTPVIATDCASGPREIIRKPEWGQIVPIGDVEAMADAIRKDISGPKRSVDDESWLPFTTESIVNQYLEYFHTLLASPEV